MVLKIITSTTREGRTGTAIAKWVTEYVTAHTPCNVELLDLAERNLPFMNEPMHPRLQQYQYEHTKLWSKTIAPADAFIIVLGEYNYGFPAPIKNALDTLFNEWKYKPVAFVSYGGLSGGLRATQMIKQVVTTLGMMPVPEQVTIPFHSKLINEQGEFQPDERIIKSTDLMLLELQKWTSTLKTMREADRVN